MITPREFIIKWIAALRSGKYTQGKGRLRHLPLFGKEKGIETHCCLGVACDIGVEESLLRVIKSENQFRIEWYYQGERDLDASFTALPRSLARFLEIDGRLFDRAPGFPVPSGNPTVYLESMLMRMNDSEDSVSFEVIADYLENTVLPRYPEKV